MTARTRRKPLSRAEWRVMNQCWRLGRATAREIYDASPSAGRRDYQTVKTILDRIVAKGYLSVSKMGPLCVYEPRRRRGEAMAEALADFVDVVLERAPQPLVAYLAEREDLGDEDVEVLREILARHRSDGEERG